MSTWLEKPWWTGRDLPLRAPVIPSPGWDRGDLIYNENGPFLLLLDCFSATAIVVWVVLGPLMHLGTLFLEGPQGLVPSTSGIISPALYVYVSPLRTCSCCAQQQQQQQQSDQRRRDQQRPAAGEHLWSSESPGQGMTRGHQQTGAPTRHRGSLLWDVTGLRSKTSDVVTGLMMSLMIWEVTDDLGRHWSDGVTGLMSRHWVLVVTGLRRHWLSQSGVTGTLRPPPGGV